MASILGKGLFVSVREPTQTVVVSNNACDLYKLNQDDLDT